MLFALAEARAIKLFHSGHIFRNQSYLVGYLGDKGLLFGNQRVSIVN
jgi:hypothetical protein